MYRNQPEPDLNMEVRRLIGLLVKVILPVCLPKRMPIVPHRHPLLLYINDLHEIHSRMNASSVAYQPTFRLSDSDQTSLYVSLSISE